MTDLDWLDTPDPARFTALRRLIDSGEYHFAVGFGGGGVPGIAGNLGLARLLEQLDLREHVDSVWGTSAGAIVAGGWASGASATEVYREVAALNRRGTVDVVWPTIARQFVGRPFGAKLPEGILVGRHFFDAIGRGLKAKTFEECPTPFRCIGVHADESLRRKVFRSGELQPAIFASMTLPGIIVPRPIDGVTYYDGGLIEKTPLLSPIAEHSRSGSDKKLLLLCTHYFNAPIKGERLEFPARFLHSLYALEDELWTYQLREARARSDLSLLLLNPHLPDSGMFDFKSVRDNLSHGHRAFQDQLQNAKLGLTFGMN